MCLDVPCMGFMALRKIRRWAAKPGLVAYRWASFGLEIGPAKRYLGSEFNLVNRSALVKMDPRPIHKNDTNKTRMKTRIKKIRIKYDKNKNKNKK